MDGKINEVFISQEESNMIAEQPSAEVPHLIIKIEFPNVDVKVDIGLN